MKWLTKWLRGQPRDPLAELRREPTAGERTALALEKLELDRCDALREGSATLHDLTNCAQGTRGHAVNTLKRDGLMSVASKRGEDGYMWWHYSITPKGRDYLAALAPSPTPQG